MMNGSNYSLSDIAAATGSNRDGNGMWGGDWASWIILFLIFGMFGWGGFGGFGGGFGGGANNPGLQGLATRSDINEGFALNGIERSLAGITQGICDSTYGLTAAINNGFSANQLQLCNGFNGVNQGFNALQAQLAQCCCDNREAISQVRYDMATQACDTRNTIQNTTRDILENNNSNTRAILDFLTQDKLATLQAENQNLKLAASQANQNAVLQAAMTANTAEIIRRTGNDCPIPAYVVPNPNCCYGNPLGVNYGYNQSCGGCC